MAGEIMAVVIWQQGKNQGPDFATTQPQRMDLTALVPALKLRLVKVVDKYLCIANIILALTY